MSTPNSGARSPSIPYEIVGKSSLPSCELSAGEQKASAAHRRDNRDGPFGGRSGKTENREDSGASHATDADRSRRERHHQGRQADLIGGSIAPPFDFAVRGLIGGYHLLRADPLVELFRCDQIESQGGVTQRCSLGVGFLGDSGCLVIADVWIESGHQHE